MYKNVYIEYGKDKQNYSLINFEHIFYTGRCDFHMMVF